MKKLLILISFLALSVYGYSQRVVAKELYLKPLGYIVIDADTFYTIPDIANFVFTTGNIAAGANEVLNINGTRIEIGRDYDELTAPSLTIANITSGGNKSLATKEYVNSVVSAGATGDTLWQIGSGDDAIMPQEGRTIETNEVKLGSFKSYVDNSKVIHYVARRNADSLLFGIPVREAYSSMFTDQTDINAYLLEAPSCKTIIIDSIFTITGNWTLPDSMELRSENMGYIAGSYTITGSGTRINPVGGKLFTTTVTLAGTWKSTTGEFPIELFGAVSDSTTDVSAAFNKTLQSFQRADLDGLYSIQDTICILRFYNVQMSPKTVIVWESGGKDLFNIHSQPFTINGNGATVLINRAGNNATAFDIDFGTSPADRILNATNGTQYGRYGFYIGNMNLYGFNWLTTAFTTAVSPNGIIAHTEENGLCYFAEIENMRFHKFDTVVSISNSGTEAYNGWKFDNLFIDTPKTRGIVIGNGTDYTRSTSHQFSNLVLQNTSTTTPTVEIFSPNNMLQGTFFDDAYDSAIWLRSTSSLNRLNFTWSGEGSGITGEFTSVYDQGSYNKISVNDIWTKFSGGYINRDTTQNVFIGRKSTFGSYTGSSSLDNLYLEGNLLSNNTLKILTTSGSTHTLAGRILGASTTQLSIDAITQLNLLIGGATKIRLLSTQFRPNTTDIMELGTSSVVWKTLYTKNITDDNTNVTLITNTVKQGESGQEITTVAECRSIAGGGTVALPTSQNYIGKLWLNESGAFGYAFFDVQDDGTVSILTDTRGSVNNSGGVNTISITDGGSNAVITNNYATSKTVCYKIDY